MDYQEIEVNNSIAPQSPNNMATASLVMGIIACVTCCCCFGGFIFGGLSIIFAILSRTERELRGQALAGIILSVIAIMLSIGALIFYMVYMDEVMMPMPGYQNFFDSLTIFPWFLTGGGI